MIPKKAWFYWSSKKPMSWLRSLGVETFRKHNPEWDVVLHEEPVGSMHPVHRSDLWRYSVMAEEGGVYFDTDTIFFAPFPDSLLEYDALVSIHKKHRFSNIGCLAANAPCPMFREIAGAARDRYDRCIEHKYWDGQLAGSPIFNRFFADLLHFDRKECDVEEARKAISERFSINLGLLPYAFITPIDSFSLYKLYNWTRFDPPPEAIGVHWYAGDRFNSKPFEKKLDASNYKDKRCYLTEAIQVALGEQTKKDDRAV